MSIFNIFKKKPKEKRIINKVVLYTISYDGISKQLKEILTKNNIKYEEIEVDKDFELSKELTGKGLDSFPFLDVDGEIVVGIDKKKLRKIFGFKIRDKMTLKDRLGYSQI